METTVFEKCSVIWISLSWSHDMCGINSRVHDLFSI